MLQGQRLAVLPSIFPRTSSRAHRNGSSMHGAVTKVCGTSSSNCAAASARVWVGVVRTRNVRKNGDRLTTIVPRPMPRVGVATTVRKLIGHVAQALLGAFMIARAAESANGAAAIG